MTSNGTHSLGARLSKWLALQVFFSFVVFSLVVYFVINGYLSARQVENLEERRLQVIHMFEEASGDNAVAELRHRLEDFLASHHELQLEIQDVNGVVFFEGYNQFTKARHSNNSQLTFTTPSITAAVPVGLATIYFDNRANRLLLTWLAVALAVSSVLAAFTVAFGASWLVKRELKPVDTLVQQIHHIRVSTFGSQLDGTQQPLELQPIVAQFNELLDRLYESYRQLENFNADVAHELNTPLTTLITSSELEMRSADKSSGLYEILGSNLEELHRMSEIIKSMLFLSRAERGSLPRCEAVTSVAVLVSEVVDYHEAMLGDADLVVSIKGDDSGYFDVPLVKRAVSNLLGNSVRYATPSSTITVEIADVDGVYTDISVINIGNTIELKAVSRLFDRFYRAEESRSKADKHHGLGLSIVAAIAVMHGGSPHASSQKNKTRIGFTMLRHNDVSV